MLGVMLLYTIHRDANGVILTCNECLHTVRVNKFTHRLGSPRTQAARAMLEHVRSEHGKEPIGKPKPQIMQRWY
jgi:hypothetical protein